MQWNIPRLLIAGTWSGVGKTTIATGLMAALKKRGMTVQPFKVGPDYIDPTYHRLAAGRPSRNLDTWMTSAQATHELFYRASRKADIAVVEGVMGLYDGHSGLDVAGSSAELAKLLGIPVLLVIDVSRLSRSAAALALGYIHFDPQLEIVGLVLNNGGSPTHLQWVKEAIEKTTSIPVLGSFQRQHHLSLPERHLGLVPSQQMESLVEFMASLVTAVESSVDIDGILNSARHAKPLPIPAAAVFPPESPDSLVPLAVAMDEAFSFYYQDNLDLLEAYGARLLPFSPLNDREVPSDAQGVYLGGGFPELYAERLSCNTSMHASLRKAAQEGKPIYAECGGLMYLSEGVVDFDRKAHPMIGLIPGWTTMTQQRVRLGYVEVECCQDNILAPQGMMLRGHVFHWSHHDGFPPAHHAYRIIHPQPGVDGYAAENLLASYVHLHFATEPKLAKNLVSACQGRVFSPSGQNQPIETNLTLGSNHGT